MRTILLTLSLIWLGTLPLIGQSTKPLLERRISVAANKITLDNALILIAKQGEFNLSFNSAILPLDSVLSFKFTQQSPTKILQSLVPHYIDLKVAGNNVILLKKAPIKKASKPSKFTVKGKVSDPITQAPVKDALVYEVTGLHSALSNEVGEYSLSFPSRNTQLGISVSRAGYRDTVLLVNPQNQDLSIALAKIPRQTGVIETLQPKEVERIESNSLAQFFIPQQLSVRSENLSGYLNRPFQISLLPLLGSNFKMGGLIKNKTSLNLIGGYSYGSDVFELGGVFNINRRHVKGLQLAGATNLTGGNVSGIQLAGAGNYTKRHQRGVQMAGGINIVGGNSDGLQMSAGLNYTHENQSGLQASGGINIAGGDSKGGQLAGGLNFVKKDQNGVQMSGLGNIVDGNSKGIQVSGGFNYVQKEQSGWQLTGGVNITGTNTNGVQVAGGANITLKDTKGLQIAAGYNQSRDLHYLQLSAGANVARNVHGAQVTAGINISHDTLSGAQIALVNYSYRQKGLQIGIINIADTSSSVSIGLINIVRKGGYRYIGLSSDELLHANINYKMGTKRLYNIYSIGTAMPPSNTPYLAAGFGLGNSVSLTAHWQFVTELSAHLIAAKMNDAYTWHNRFKAQFLIEPHIGKHFSIGFGPSANMLLYERSSDIAATSIAPYSLFQANSPEHILDFWVGGSLALGYRF